MILITIIINQSFEETENIISSDPPYEEGYHDSQRYPLIHYLINNTEDIIVFLGCEVFISINLNSLFL